MDNLILNLPSDDYRDTKFNKFHKRMAVKAVSRCHLSAFVYLFFAMALITVIQTVMMFVMGEEQTIKLFSEPYVIWGLQVLVMYILAYPVFLLMVRKLPKAERLKSSMSFKEFLALFCIGTALMSVGSNISMMITEVIYEQFGLTQAETTIDLIEQTPIELIILVAVIIGPIFEELIFRKAFIDRISIYGDRMAVVISSFAFGLFHGNVDQLIYATALGFVLGYIYTKTRRIGLSILMHMLLNFMGTVPSLLIMDNIEKIADIDPETLVEDADIMAYMTDALPVIGVSLLQNGIAFIGIILLIKFIFDRKHKLSRECDVKVPFYHLPRVAIFNIGTIIFIVFCALQIVSTFIPYEEVASILRV